MFSKQKRLDVLSGEVSKCQSCRLHEGRTQTVFGEGDLDAKVVFVGEAPGQTEDETGRPFVGRAGKLLDNMIASMGLKREDVYIANICKCLRYNAMVLLENGTYERISKLVATKYNGRVMSVDGSIIVPKRVIGWYSSRLDNRNVYKLSFVSSKRNSNGFANVVLTEDHKVLTTRGWVKVSDLDSADQIATGIGISDISKQILIGTMLGDGHISKASSYLSFSHSNKQSDYLEFKKEVIEFGFYTDDVVVKLNNKTYYAKKARTKASRALAFFRKEFYPNGIKIVPKNLILTPISLAFWFMDDGYTKHKNSCCLSEIAAHSFTDDDRLFLVEQLKKLGLDSYQRSKSRGRILFDKENSRKLSEMISPYVCDSMRYKLARCVDIAFDRLLLNPGLPVCLYDNVVVEKTTIPEKIVYCIDVEDTHNFVTAGGVVHNCRPPGNRKPKPDEMDTCKPYLAVQLGTIKPKVIVALGNTALEGLTGRGEISKRCGDWEDWFGWKLMPCYHPSALLRNPNWKTPAWNALQKVAKELL